MSGDDGAALVYLDANALIDLIEGEPRYAEPIRKLFAAAEDHVGRLVTSELTLAEVLAPSRETGARSDGLQARYFRLVLLRSLRWQPIDRAVLLRTVGVREAFRLKLPDAIHYATALESGCRHIVTRDRRIRRLSSQIAVIDGDVAMDRLIEALFD